jgi:hypothetical protein
VSNQTLSRGFVAVNGTVNPTDFSRYKVEYVAGSGGSDRGYSIINEVSSRVTNGVLAVWNTKNLPAGAYTLRLTVVQSDRANWYDPRCEIQVQLP